MYEIEFIQRHLLEHEKGNRRKNRSLLPWSVYPSASVYGGLHEVNCMCEVVVVEV